MQFFLCIGFLISYVIGPFTSYSTLIMISGSVSFLCMILFIWVPESPHFLLSKDRKQEALEALYWFRGYPEKILLQTEIADILVHAVYFYLIVFFLFLFFSFIFFFIFLFLFRHQLMKRSTIRVLLKYFLLIEVAVKHYIMRVLWHFSSR